MDSNASADYRSYWYEVCDDQSLRQGDILLDLTAYWVAEPSEDESAAKVAILHGNFIIVSASCDVEQDGYEYVLLNRVYPVNEENLHQRGDDLKKAVEVMRRGLIPAKFLLASTDAIDPEFPLSFVTSKLHTLLPLTYIRAQCGVPRLRLRSPVREMFGNWVAGCFGRVGLEEQAQIPRASKSLYPGTILKLADD